MDRYLVSGAVLALIVELLVLFADSRWIEIPFLTPQISQKSAGHKIGKIESIRQSVRHRSRDAISWERSEHDEPLHDFDSVLTLSQSSASLRIDKEIGLRLDENTLVTLEPRSAESRDSGLRLRLSKGVLNARNKNAPLGVQVKEWTVDAVSGSELNVKTTDDGKVDLELLAGEAKLRRGEEEVRVLEQGSRVNIENDKIARVEKIVLDVKWRSDSDRDRIYSHEEPIRKKFSWQGVASSLRVTAPDKTTKEIPLNGEQRDLELLLAFGSHHLTLVSEHGVSRSFEVQVWRAPIVRYFTPLPRDRVKTGDEALFTWQAIEGLRAFRFQIGNTEFAPAPRFDRTLREPRVREKLVEEGDFSWRVIAVDDEGYEIPAYYLNPIYSVREPLRAPVLKKPNLRAPAKEKENKRRDGASVSGGLGRLVAGLLVSERAQAESEELYEVQFDWEPIEGASHYVIEISRTADFQKPLVLKESRQASFVWREVKMGRYYWRVAAGRAKQRGLFSEVSEIDMKALREGAANDDGVTLRLSRVEKPAPQETAHVETPPATAATPEPTPKPFPAVVELETPAPAIETKATERKKLGSFEIRLGAPYLSRTFQGDPGFKGALTGVGAMSAEAILEIDHGSRRSIFDIRYQRVKWKKPEDNPFQTELSEQTIDIRYAISRTHSAWQGGIAARREPAVLKDDVETVKLHERWIFGPEATYRSVFSDRFSIATTLGLLVGEGTFGGSARGRLVRSLGGTLQNGWQLGCDLNFVGTKGTGSAQGITSEAGVWLGHRW